MTEETIKDRIERSRAERKEAFQYRFSNAIREAIPKAIKVCEDQLASASENKNSMQSFIRVKDEHSLDARTAKCICSEFKQPFVHFTVSREEAIPKECSAIEITVIVDLLVRESSVTILD